MISIHALREEGDTLRLCSHFCIVYFYPRPPRGGRQYYRIDTVQVVEFLSTPSARRATFRDQGCFSPAKISIHALREEGDNL